MAKVTAKTMTVTHVLEHGFVSFVKAIRGWFHSIDLAQSRVAEFEKLQAMTDVELATRYGITRAQIAEFVFSDRAYYTM